jgi:hypothetical protein
MKGLRPASVRSYRDVLRLFLGFRRAGHEAQDHATRASFECVPLTIQSWSLTSLQQRLFKTGGRLIRHAPYFILQPG